MIANNMKVIYKPKGKAGEYADYALNLYKGCSNGCKYCYVPKFTNSNPITFQLNIKPRDILRNLEYDCIINKGKIKENVVLCFLCDPYPLPDNTFTRKALIILNQYQIPFTILTKGGLRAIRDFDLYNTTDIFAETLTLIDDKDTEQYEPYAEKFNSRLQALQIAKDKNIKTWVSLEPVIRPNITLEIIKQTKEVVDLFKIGKLNYENTNIDWLMFKNDVINLCNQLNVKYMLKQDLINL